MVHMWTRQNRQGTQMSEQVTNIGYLRKIPKFQNETTENIARKILSEKHIDINGYGSYTECLQNELSDTFTIIENEVYQITIEKSFYDEDIFHATKMAQGRINFVVSFYNGGCCLSEALEEALKNIGG